MREIKFRAWDKKYNQMVSWDDISKNNIIGALINNNNRSISHGVLMQFTGLLDKNGVEIYEGDIVRKLSGDYKLGKVVFEFGMFCFESIGCGIYAGSDAFLHIHSLHYKGYNSNNNYEVIGNIYEHPHLLGGE
jgi:uncharacterized phage protein (TIGR01671 family)